MSAKKPPPVDGPIVEIDAIDEAEWEQDKHTPQVQDAQLSRLVKESKARPAKPPPIPKRAITASTVKRSSTNVVPAKPAPGAAPRKPAAPASAAAKSATGAAAAKSATGAAAAKSATGAAAAKS